MLDALRDRLAGELNSGKLKTSIVVLKEQYGSHTLLRVLNTIGTAEVLLRIQERLKGKGNVLLISGDVIADPALIRSMTDTHLSKNAALTMLLCHRPQVSVVQCDL